MSLYRRSSEESLRPASQWRETLRERAEDMLQTLDTPLDKLQVAQVLARMGDPSGESVVLQQLQPGGAQIIAQQIVPLLVKIQPESGRGTRLVQALGRLLTDPSRSDDARATTATVLGRVGTPEARETLREGLAREATEPVRAAIESALSTKPAPHSGAQKWGSVLRAWTAGRNDPRRPGLHKG